MAADRYDIHVFPSEEDEVFYAVSPAFGSGLSAFGDTPEEALAEFRKVLEAAVGVYREEGWELPRPRTHSGQLRVRMPQSLHAQLALVAQAERVSLNTLIVSYLAERAGYKSKSGRPC